MAALPNTGFSTDDITKLLNVISPAGSFSRTTAPEETDSTKGATNTNTKIDPSQIIQAIGGNSTSQTIGPSSTTQNIGASTATTNVGASSSKSVVGPSDKTSVVGPSETTNVIGATNGSHTTTQYVSPQAVTEYVNQILQGSQGLAATAQQSHASGGYNDTTQGMLVSDLVARTAGQAALLNKSTTTTDHTDASTNTTNNTGYTTTNHDTGYTTTTDNSGRTDVTHNSGSTNTLLNSGSTNSLVNSGSVNTTNNSGLNTNVSTNPVTDIVKTAGTNTVQTQQPQVSGKIAAGLAAGTLIYNALGQLVNKATGSIVNKITDSVFGSNPDIASSVLTGTDNASVDAAVKASYDNIPELNPADFSIDGLDLGGDAIATANSVTDLTAESLGSIGLSPEVAASLTDTGFLDAATTAAGSDAASAAIADAASSIGADALAFMGPAAAATAIAKVAGDALGIKEVGQAINGVTSAVGDVVSGVVDGAKSLLDWIICTELSVQGRMPARYYRAGASVFDAYPQVIKDGYFVWAIPSVFHLRKYPQSRYSKLLALIFNWRAENIAAHSGVKGARKLWKGAAVTAFLYPICFILGVICTKKDYHVVYK